MTVPARRALPVREVEGELEGPRRRRVALFTEPLTAGELRRYLGREVTILTRREVWLSGVLIDVDAAAHLLEGVRPALAIPLEEILALRLRRSRDNRAQLIAALLARIVALEARVADLEGR